MIRRLFTVAMLVLAPPLAAQRTTVPLDSTTGRIMFFVDETFADSAGRTQVVLHARTEKGSRCGERLTAHSSTSAGTITIDRWRFQSNSGCLDEYGGGPAVGSIWLAIGAGRHVLAIAHLGAVDRYRLTVTGGEIRVAPIGTPRVSVLRDTTPLVRFPRNSLALRCSTGPHTAWTCAEVFHLLADEPGLVPIEIPHTGRNPYDPQRFGENDDVGAGMRYFRVTTPASYARLVRDLQRLHGTYAGGRVGLSVAIRRWNGEWWSANRVTETGAP